MLHLRSHAPAVVLAGWLPRGFISTGPIRELVEGFVPGHWPGHPSYWAVAADYSSGKRVAFGRDDAPTTSAGDGGRRLVRDPGLLPPGQRRRPTLRRRRDLLDLESGSAVRGRPRPRRLPEPHVVGGARRRRLARRSLRAAHARRGRTAPGPRSPQAAPRGHRRARPAARRRRLRPHGPQPHERLAPRPGHGAGPQVGGARAAPPARDAPAAARAHAEPPARRTPGRDAAGAPRSAQHFGPTFSSSSATLVRCEIEMLRWLDCVQRSPSRSQLSQNRPRMSADRLLKK